MELPYSTAAIIGLIGSTHCLGMCGGIIGALGNGLQTHKKQNTISMLLCHLTYNAGRIVSYMIAGAIVGTIANQVGQLHLAKALPAGGFIAALILIALALVMLAAGADGMPRRHADWAQGGWMVWGDLILLFGSLMALAFILYAMNMIKSRRLEGAKGAVPAAEPAE